jgi:hypothetical protein
VDVTTAGPAVGRSRRNEEDNDMSKATAGGGDAGTTGEEETSEVVESLTSLVDQWKARIDELKVQADLVKLDTREQATKQLDIAQNVCLAAYSKLRDAGHDAHVNAGTLREGVQQLLHDIKEAFDAAQAVISRG